MTNSYSLKEIQLRFGIPQHVLIHLCEKGVIKPEIADPQGRGKVREFSSKNVFEFALALELRKYEIPLARIKAILEILNSFERSITKSFPTFQIPHSFQQQSPSTTLYLFNGSIAVFEFGKKSLISFNLSRVMAGDAKRASIELLNRLPTEYASYLKVDFHKLADDII